MLNKDIYLEKNLFIDIAEKKAEKILDMFRIGQTTQLPVLENGKVMGILDLFVFLSEKHQNINIRKMMNQDVIIAGRDEGIFTFSNSWQKILLFEDREGIYLGYIKRDVVKVYLPNLEHEQIFEGNFSYDIKDDEDLKEDFKAILESSYDGLYVTVGKGITLSINNTCEQGEGVKSDRTEMVQLADGKMKPQSFSFKSFDKKNSITIIQNLQNRKEFVSAGNNVLNDGEVIRITTSSPDIKELNRMKEELHEAQKLAEKYQSELEVLRWEQTKTDGVVASSPKMKKIVAMAKRVAKVDSTVLIQGESGTGKEIISKLIHRNSERKNGPFIKVDCGSIPESLLESELFGYEKGAFTGASSTGKIGLIELANGGTLFLDEIGELPLSLQPKLLRVLQDREIIRIGGKEQIPVDIRIIAATNRDLKEMVEEKTFREDLYYRLNVVPIFIPPLRERREDIQPLIINALEKYNREYGLQKEIEPEAMRYLIDFDWPGNVRELENIIERLIVTTSSEIIRLEHLPKMIKNHHRKTENIIDIDHSLPYKEAMDDFEKKLLLSVKKKSKNTQEMADILKIDRSTISRKLKKHGIKTP